MSQTLKAQLYARQLQTVSWEYRMAGSTELGTLNALGHEGWEAVAQTPEGLLMKRRTLPDQIVLYQRASAERRAMLKDEPEYYVLFNPENGLAAALYGSALHRIRTLPIKERSVAPLRLTFPQLNSRVSAEQLSGLLELLRNIYPKLHEGLADQNMRNELLEDAAEAITRLRGDELADGPAQ